MANGELIYGVDTFQLYGVETTYGTAATPDTHLGLVQENSPTLSRNLRQIKASKGDGSGGQETVATLGGSLDGGLSIPFKPINFDHLQYILGSRTGSGTGADPYIYTRDDKPSTLTITENLDNVDDDDVLEFLGCACERWQLRSGTDEEPQITMDFNVKDFTIDSTLNTNTSLPSGDPYNFDGFSLEAPDGTTIDNIITTVSISITREGRFRKGMSYTNQSYGFGGISFEITFDAKYLDTHFLEKFASGTSGITTPTSYATAALKFTNGANKYVDFVFTDVFIPQDNLTGRINDDLNESVTMHAHSLTVTEQQSA